ncbi:NifB/NifX family molybdenum-iron cluster-binding protein [Desulfosporosinus sp. BG]|uniref:NifB/NifX family molybdenum-iron cluster-binding protein n=1 Tax=Desulfosporosinus sp. BG TaxID=1633135 RepID=UPI00083AAA78|nr:NifB/NifX family molybdenum-iron cluster-binding protein [Desulfosporosinus sp. BG]ODA39512.1 Glycine-rich cell wall structural protein precursor [Desulfosporosinus sp. BG]
MRIAISTGGCGLDKFVDDRFGRCPYFVFCDSEDPQSTAEYKDNPALSGTGGAGIAAAEYMAKEKVEVLITGSLGPNALRVINGANIPAYTASEDMTLSEAILAWKEGRLTQITEAGAAHAGER